MQWQVGKAQKIPCPSYSKTHPRSHQPTMSPSPQSQKSPKAGRNPNYGLRGKETLCGPLPRLSWESLSVQG